MEDRIEMKKEYFSRLQTLQDYLERNNIDVAMITEPSNVFYFTGFLSEPFERFMALVLDIKKGKAMLFVPALDKTIASNESIVENVIPISDEENPIEILQKNISDHLMSIGLEKKSVHLSLYEDLRAAFSNVSFIDVQPFNNSMRKRKSRTEVESIKQSIQIIENVLEEGLKKVKVGMTELELVAELEYLMRKLGADGPSFSTIVLSGEKSALPHGIPGSRKLEHGDFLLIDFGVLKNGYCSDITRTFVIGEATNKQREIYEIVLEATNAGIAAVQSGVPIKEFDLAARSVIEKSGYGEYFNNRVGHGLGVEIHEEPSIHQKNEEIAEPRLLFTIEPGIYIPNFGGVRIEDNVYINEQGKVEVLTSFPKELKEI